jgi:hypothetical protein
MKRIKLTLAVTAAIATAAAGGIVTAVEASAAETPASVPVPALAATTERLDRGLVGPSGPTPGKVPLGKII